MSYEDIFMEGYEDAINDILNEASSTQKYLNHRSVAGDILSNGIASAIRSSGRKNGSVANLYDNYVAYCQNNLDCKPLSREQFIREGKKFYANRQTTSLYKFLANFIIPFSGSIGGAVYNRSSSFKNAAHMIDDYDEFA